MDTAAQRPSRPVTSHMHSSEDTIRRVRAITVTALICSAFVGSAIMLVRECLYLIGGRSFFQGLGDFLIHLAAICFCVFACVLCYGVLEQPPAEANARD